jgi:2',3'-cyclic-nucleotide 2'-phosphodiesterase (5'-nucleotidase family)
MIRKALILIVVNICLVGCSRHYVKYKQQFEHAGMKDQAVQPIMNDSITRYKKKVKAATSRVIAISAGKFTRDGDETTLGNFVCDALRYAGDKYFDPDATDIVIVNRGGLRADLPAGEITVGHIFELMPFDNEMVQVKLKGESLLELLPLMKEKKHPFYGFELKILPDKSVKMTVRKMEIIPSKTYTIITSDYLVNGGDNFTFLKEGEIKSSNMKIRDAIVSYCDALKEIKPYKDGRMETTK